MKGIEEKNKLTQQTSTPRWANLIGIIFLLTIIDFNAKIATHPKLQYIIVVIPLCYILLSQFEKNIQSAFWLVSVFASVLWIFGMSGVYWGKIVERNTDGALPLIWPMAILMFGTMRPNSNEDTTKGLILLARLANLISFESIIARLFFPSSLYNFSHEKAYLIFFSLFIGLRLQKKSIVYLTVILLIANFIAYPALTYAICGLSALIVHFSLRKNFGFKRLLVFQFISLFFLYTSTFRLSNSNTILDAPYKFLNRINNVGYRDYLIRQVVTQISEQPYFGSLFRRSVLIEGVGRSLPVHNDFVTVVLGGGIFSLLLYLGLYIITNYKVFTLLPRVIDKQKINAIVCLTILVNSYFFCSIANPVSMKPQNGMVLCAAIYSIKMIFDSSGIQRK